VRLARPLNRPGFPATPGRFKSGQVEAEPVGVGDHRIRGQAVSAGTDVVVSPQRTVTSAEKPCPAISPAPVRPGSNGAPGRSPAANGARVMVPPPVSRASRAWPACVGDGAAAAGS